MKKPINKFYHFILHILTSCTHKLKKNMIEFKTDKRRRQKSEILMKKRKSQRE